MSYYEAIRRAVARHNCKVRRDGKLLIPSELLPRWHPNQLRHALATDAADKLDADSAGLLLGHRTRRAADTYVDCYANSRSGGQVG
jgi:hypothetical protein